MSSQLLKGLCYLVLSDVSKGKPQTTHAIDLMLCEFACVGGAETFYTVFLWLLSQTQTGVSQYGCAILPDTCKNSLSIVSGKEAFYS